MLRFLIVFLLASVPAARAQVVECLAAQKQLIEDNKIEMCILHPPHDRPVSWCFIKMRVQGVDPTMDLTTVQARIMADREAATDACGKM